MYVTLLIVITVHDQLNPTINAFNLDVLVSCLFENERKFLRLI